MTFVCGVALQVWLIRRMYKSQLLSSEEVETWQKSATILEQDERGIKVMRLADANILKIFRVRHAHSVARCYSYARRFCRNADRLQSIDIPTVRIRQLYHLETPGVTAVLYEPLQGVTLRDLLATRRLTVPELHRLGEFFAYLHQRGVHFRSLHLGNIVLNTQDEFGLIDIADMRMYPWALWCNTRVRSFKHIQRYPSDIQALGSASWQQVLAAYFSAANISLRCARKLSTYLEKHSVVQVKPL